jgi:GYF domain 2
MISIDAFARNGSGNAGAATRKEQWFVATRAGIFPMTADAIEQSLERGRLHATTKVWTSGMRAWASLGSIVGLDPKPDSLRSAPASYPPPLPARSPGPAGPVSASPARESPPAPVVQTVIRRRFEAVSAPPVERPAAHGARSSAARAFDAPRPIPAYSTSTRWLSWVRSRETWQCVLFSFVAGTALGLMMYHRLLWGAPNESVAQHADGNPERGVEMTRSGLQAAASTEAPHSEATPREALAPPPVLAPGTPLERAELQPENPVRSATTLPPPAAAKHSRSAHRRRARPHAQR